MRFQEESCLVLRTFISLSVREKKAILEPDTINDITNRNRIMMTSMVVACAFITNKGKKGYEVGKILLKG
jgi:hypothetical protein